MIKNCFESNLIGYIAKMKDEESMYFIIKLKTVDDYVYTIKEIKLKYYKHEKTKNDFLEMCKDVINQNFNEINSDIKINKTIYLDFEQRIIGVSQIKDIWVDMSFGLIKEFKHSFDE